MIILSSSLLCREGTSAQWVDALQIKWPCGRVGGSGGGATLYFFGTPTGEGRPEMRFGTSTKGAEGGREKGKRAKRAKRAKKGKEWVEKRKWQSWSLNLIAVNGCSFSKSGEDDASNDFPPNLIRSIIGFPFAGLVAGFAPYRVGCLYVQYLRRLNIGQLA